MAAEGPPTPARRRLSIPPAPRWQVDPRAPDGLAVLADFVGPAWEPYGDLGVALWLAAREVQVWTLTPTFARASAEPRAATAERFAEAAQAVPELAPAWEAFSRLVTASGSIDPRALAEACHDVYAWAEERSLVRTAARFAELAAFLDEDDPTFADSAGWAWRRVGEHDRSEEFHLRGLALSIHRRDRKEAVRALLGYGTLQRDRGRIKAARRAFERALRRARRSGKRRLAARAQRYLFMLSAEAGTYEEAIADAWQALDITQIYDPDLPQLAHNFAFLLLRYRHFSAALTLLNSLPAKLFAPHDQLLLYGSIGWAAGGAGRRREFEEAVRGLQSLAGSVEEPVAAAWMHLGQGAWHLRDWESAEECMRHGRDLAAAQGELGLRQEAEIDRQRILAHEPLPLELLPTEWESLRSLISRFSSRIRRWLAPGPGKPHNPGADTTPARGKP